MNVENIRLINFRNYRNIYFDFNEKINIFIGNNAQGKTNLMEAIYMCSSGKSFRSNRDREIINFHKEEAYMGANICLDEYKKFIEIKLEKNKSKRIRINKSELSNYRELNSGLNVIVFTPEKLRIIKDGPQERRNLIDEGLGQLKPLYAYNLNKYRKLLFQRNNLLKSSRFKKDIRELVDLFDVQIASVASQIIMERANYIEKLSIEGEKIHRDLTKDLEKLDIEYISCLPLSESREEMEKRYLDLMRKNLASDLEYGSSQIGPHRDDLALKINDKDIRTYGSQGQQRTAVLSLVLSEVNIIKNERGLYPVLILDDVFSELDEDRRNYLIRLFENIQVFITTTNYEDLEILKDFKKSIFYIEKGQEKIIKEKEI